MICLAAVVAGAPEPYGALPSAEQVEYQRLEIVGFIHFGMNTFTGREWGTGKEDEALFNPTRLDAGQWAEAFARGNVKQLLLTAKHHDGFCLWPSASTNHTVARSGYKGDVVREYVDACRKHGRRAGFYLSPWDMNNECYGEGNARGCDYNDVYVQQQTELLTNYGRMYEQWLDGAKGEGLPQTYYFQQWREVARRLQPGMLIFGSDRPDIRWNGNEAGKAADPVWSKVNLTIYIQGTNTTSQSGHGQADGDWWSPAEADFSIRPGWFYHEAEDDRVMDGRTLVQKYFDTVGHNQQMLLNVPPNKEGLLADPDVRALEDFGRYLNNTFARDLLNGTATASSTHTDNAAGRALDADYDSYWAAADGELESELAVELAGAEPFDVVMLQEYIPLGQRVAEFHVYCAGGDGAERELASGQTIGYKRLALLDAPTTCARLRVAFRGLAPVVINRVALYRLAVDE